MPINQNELDKKMVYLKTGKDIQFFRETSYNYTNGEVNNVPALVAPTISGATGGSLQISVAFGLNADASSYIIEYNKTSTPTVKLYKEGVSSPIVLTGLDAATEYKIRIKAVKSSSNGDVDVYQSAFSADSTASTS